MLFKTQRDYSCFFRLRWGGRIHISGEITHYVVSFLLQSLVGEEEQRD